MNAHLELVEKKKIIPNIGNKLKKKFVKNDRS